MDLFSLDEMFKSPGQDDSPGARLYLYRLLQVLASEETSGATPPISYEGAKQLSRKIGLGTPEKLVQLFDDLGLGTLTLDLGQDRIMATLNPRKTPPSPGESSSSACELERGLIDGALETITGIPVTTVETTCWARGDRACCFEASREVFNGTPTFKPVATGDRLRPTLAGHTTAAQRSTAGLRGWHLDAVGREIARSKRHQYSLSLLYLDLDNLGEINDSMGTDAGDQVINAVATSLGRSCRAEDFLWHHGEDEFIVVLAETDTGCAEVVARRLITEILSAAEYVDFAASVSASIGFSTYPTHAETMAQLLESARSALYLAKSLGKGRAQAAWDDADIQIETPHRECDKHGDSLFDWPAYRPDRKKADRAGAGAGVGSDMDMSFTEVEETHSPEVDSDRRTGGDGKEPETPNGPEAIEETREVSVPGESIRESKGPDDAAAVDDAGLKLDEEIHTSPGTEETSVISAITASISPLLLKGMQQALAAENGFSIISEVKDPGKLEDVIADLRPDLVFTDKEMATSDQFAGLRALKEENPNGKFVIFTAEVDQDILRAAADFSVDGIIFQDASQKDVLSSMKNVIDGQRLLPEAVQAAIDELEHHRLLLNELSERELEVLKLVAAGKSNSQISKELYITVNTVRFHLANIYQKLNVSNRTEAANYFLRQGLEGNEEV